MGLKPVRQMSKERKTGGSSEVSKPAISGVVCPRLNGMSMTQGGKSHLFVFCPCTLPAAAGAYQVESQPDLQTNPKIV